MRRSSRVMRKNVVLEAVFRAKMAGLSIREEQPEGIAGSRSRAHAVCVRLRATLPFLQQRISAGTPPVLNTSLQSST
jgi:hypothetical protein